MIQFTNTLTKKKEPFTVSDSVKMYVCGVTPYDHAHVGHGRCYVSFDIINRLLSFLGEPPLYCRNFTDIDDKLLNKAEREFGDRLRFREIADRYIASFKKDMSLLNCLSPQVEPRVTDHIPQIIDFIQLLIDKGHAYNVGGDVYFAVDTYSQYGKLSKQDKNQLYEGTRNDVREEKKSPLDFALWKREPEGEFWNSPWGYGRPGWHIECSVLARVYLGDMITIHGGGLDLIFPHHENEIAQSESLLGHEFARCWMHNGFVTVNKEKMSKSLGNFFTLNDIFTSFDPMALRYYFITHHYRAPLEFSFELLQTAQKVYQRLAKMFARDDDGDVDYSLPLIQRMLECLQDDVNTPAFLGLLFEHSVDINNNKALRVAVKSLLVTVLGLTLDPLAQEQQEITPEIQKLIDDRDQARKDKDWKKADELRDALQELGITVQDTKL